MAIFTLLESIDKNTSYPLVCEFSAPSNCGTLALELDSEWTDQMLFELPCINFKILKSDGTLFKTFDINMSTVNTDVSTGITQSKPYIIPFYDIPNTGSFHITPMFDKNAISAHNEMEKNGIVPVINTNNEGIVTSDDISIWENTDIFDVTIEFNNENIASGGSGGGGGDTPVLIEKTITANGTYNAEDDEADGYSSVIADVPNTYTVEDEGKVVYNGTLVAQGSDTVTTNGDVDTTLISNLTVNVPTGGGGESRKAVNFIDYDGTIVHSYTVEEFANLTEWPSNPEHEGLTAQGWMWSTFAKAKSYVEKYGSLDIGQKYRITDGKTRIFIALDEWRREPVLGLGVNGSVDIDWGDGSEHTTLTGTNVNTYVSTDPHEYPDGGDYVITLTVTGTAKFLSKNSTCGLLMKSNFNSSESYCYRNAIKKLFIGDSVTSIGDLAFYTCCSLESVTIPDSVTSFGSGTFSNCYSLISITIPDSVTSVTGNFNSGNYSLRSITIPDSVTFIDGYAFANCYPLDSITIPNSVTSLSDNVFSNSYSLASIIIPDSVRQIGSRMLSTGSNTSLGSITFGRTTPPSILSNTFNAIPTDCVFLVKSIAYLSASNYPSPSTYTYAYYDTFADGATLPSTIPNESTTALTWYATISDLRAETSPITVGNGKQVYAKMTAV